MASKAQSRGAQYHFSSLVVDIVPQKDNTLVETLCSGTREIFKARAVVLANGFKPRLPMKLGFGRIKNFLVGAQAEIEAKNIGELEVYFSQEMAPGAFAWLVPTSPDKAYIGLLATSHARLHLQKFLDDLFGQGRVASRAAKIEQKPIPVGNLTRSYGHRILAIGDATGQVKPTTGGGIYFGHIGARIAAGVLDEALRHDTLTAGRLSRYQKQWKAKMGRELSQGYRARWAYTKLNDRQIEGIFNALDASGTAEALLNSGDFSFDWHSKLITAVLKRGSAYPFLKIKKLLYSEAGS
jgi:flavin-dependent dehydrogenase